MWLGAVTTVAAAVLAQYIWRRRSESTLGGEIIVITIVLLGMVPRKIKRVMPVACSTTIVCVKLLRAWANADCAAPQES
jgi:hypothetical protein